MSWQQSMYADAAERLGVGEGVMWSIAVDPNRTWMEFWREDDPARRVRYAVRACVECGGRTSYWYVESGPRPKADGGEE